MLLFVFEVKWLRVNLHLICPEGIVIKGGSYFYFVFKVKGLRRSIESESCSICSERIVIECGNILLCP